MSVRPIQVSEWRWVFGCAVAVLGLAAVPYALALLHPPEGHLLAKTLYYGNDLSQYLAAMGDGRASDAWLVQDHLTSEPHAPALMYPFYVLLGKLAGLVGLPSSPVFALSVVMSVLALVFAGYGFAAALVDSVRERRLALLFILFASGLGIWVAALSIQEGSQQVGRSVFAYDRAEASSYLLPFGPPHLPLALAMLLLWGRGLVQWVRGGSAEDSASQEFGWASLGLLLLATLAVGLLNSFSLVSMVAVAIVHVLARWILTAHFPRRQATAALLVAGVSAPLLAVSFATFALDPFWSAAYGDQNQTSSPPLWALMVDLGVLLPLAVVGALWGKAGRDARLLLSVWAVTLVALMYLPVPFQRRFGFGLQPAVAVLAALGVARLGSLLSASRPSLWRPGAFRVAVSTLAFGGTMLGYALLVMAGQGVGGLGKAIFEPVSSFEASDWLALQSTADDVVLASPETGNFLAGRIRGRVVAGHDAGTLDAPRKAAMVNSFFHPSATPAERRRILAEERVTFIFVGTRERLLGGGSLPGGEGFTLAHTAGDVRIYRVERSPAPPSP